MNLDGILNTAIRQLKTVFPEAIYKGKIVSIQSEHDPNTNTVDQSEKTKDVEIIFDSVKTEEIAGSTIKDTAIKIYIIANEVKSIDFRDLIRVNGLDYIIRKKLDSVVGSKTALFTVIAEI